MFHELSAPLMLPPADRFRRQDRGGGPGGVQRRWGDAAGRGATAPLRGVVR